MDISQIPRSFWHTLSVSILAATFGVLFIAYKSSNISIGIANAKIEISSAISQAKDIKSQLESENQRLVNANNLLTKRINWLENKLSRNAKARITIDDFKKNSVFLKAKPQSVRMNEQKIISEQFKALENKLQSVEQSIRKY